MIALCAGAVLIAAMVLLGYLALVRRSVPAPSVFAPLPFAMFAAGANGGPVLFLNDEILSGTNSKDRRLAAEAILRVLLERGAIDGLSTHDLTLTELAELPGLCGMNVQMESRDADDPLDFDYVVKPGVTEQSSALAIARVAGVPVQT